MNIIQKNNISSTIDLSANKDLMKNLEYKYKSNSIFENNYMIEYWKVRHSLDGEMFGEILYDLKNSIIQSIIKKYYNKDTL